ncbi:hypothetical protein MMC21_008081 [Puttea exsequens]|nr:hypothetical protein [Puttea exsequens]
MHLIVTALSFILATTPANAQSPTSSPGLPTLIAPSPTPTGNASDILTYPICAQTCGNETAPFLAATIPGCNASIVECACSAYYRSETAACEEVTCSAEEYETTQALAQQLCVPLYSSNSTLSTSVAAAIASATSVAAAAATGKDVLNLSSYPACAQNCTIIHKNGGCDSQNLTCICNPPASIILGNCEVAQCSPSDLEIVTDLSFRLCAPVGGINEGVNLTGSLTQAGNASLQTTPVPSAFTGGTACVVASAGAWVFVATVSIVTGTLAMW